MGEKIKQVATGFPSNIIKIKNQNLLFNHINIPFCAYHKAPKATHLIGIAF